MSATTIDSDYRNLLGEGMAVLSSTYWWLDILNQQMFRRDLDGMTACFDLPEMASKVLEVEYPRVLLASESGVCEYDVESFRWTVVFPEPLWTLGETYRSNDGAVLGDGYFIYGRMRQSPCAGCGDLVLVTPTGSQVIHQGIAIPNTFIWLADESVLLVSDSLERLTYALTLDLDGKRVTGSRVWRNFRDYHGTPDGAFLTPSGNIYIAMWGAATVLAFDRSGRQTSEIAVPVLQPTSCWVDHEESEMIVTSATEGMTPEQMKTYPLSGYTIRQLLPGRAP